ncbi:MAG TPA: BTAD domain-containing putative transcriptional regulator [Streptosporangiaceae bacterium]|nr:BTAD domain-containing putative transcriptional regulator [Streptosporangiaceae bacterium]
MIYRLLGDLEISGDDGRSLTLPTGKALAVLAALLINPNRLVAKGYLLKAAWGDSETQEAQLHKSINAVRRVLEQIGRRDHLITHQKSGYELQVDDADLDMVVFRRLVRQAEEAAGSGRPGSEVGLLREALGLWRGPHPLSNVPEALLGEEREALESRRKLAAVRLFDLELAARNYAVVQAEATPLAGDFPADQRLCEQLMIAAYRNGHPADAAGVYERYTRVLEEQTGSRPDPALRNLAYAIGRSDEEAVTRAEQAIARRAGASSGAGPGAGSRAGGGGGARAGQPAVLAVPRQLPPRPADFTGRGDLVAEVSWLLGREPAGEEPEPPVIVITGPGGVGKSALALDVAHRSAGKYPGGQLYLDLGGTTTEPVLPGEALAQFLRAFGFEFVPELVAERAAQFRSLLAGRRVLIMLDDAASGAQVRALIPAHPGCAVVITSRRRLADLDVTHHHVAPLAPLDPATARELFVRRVASFGVELDGDDDAVDRVVALCGGLPLALRIAAALRVHQDPLPTAELAGWLARQGLAGFAFGELNLARTIEAGCNRLDRIAQQLFEDLGLLQLRSYATWTAAALLDGLDIDPARALAELAAASMLEPATPGVRYRFHELTRDYALQRASRRHPDQADRRLRCRRAYRALLTLARQAHAALYGGDFEVVHCDEPDWEVPAGVRAEVSRAPLEWFESERANIRAAVSHCAELGLTGICWDLAFSAHEFYTLHRYFDDWFATSTTALAACRAAGDVRGEGIMLTSLGQPALVASRAGRVSGLPDLDRAVALLAESGDQHGRAIALRTLASALRRRGQLTRPLQLFTEALAGYQAAGDTVGEWQALRLIGQAHLDRGEHHLARSRLQEALEVAMGVDDPRLRAQTWYWVGMACLAVGDLKGAEPAFSALRGVFPRPPELGHAYALHGLAELARHNREPEVAASYLAAAARLADQAADATLKGRVYLSEASLHEAAGQAALRLRALEQAVACFDGGGAAAYHVLALDDLARARASYGDYPAAQAARDQADQQYEAMDLPEEDRAYRHRPSWPGSAS